MAPNIARRAFFNIDDNDLAFGSRRTGVTRSRRRSRYGRPLHPTGDGHSRLWNLSAGGRRRADRRTAKALRTTGFNRGASSSSCEVRSPCRLAGIPARTWRCTPAPHSGRGSTWDKRHRVPPDTAGKCEPVWQAAGPEVAWRARPRSQAMPEQYACPAGRSALARPPRAMKQQATKQNLPKPLLPLS
jgi:hypothetical protein